MIFDNNVYASSSVSLDSVQESPYELGYSGALMHVYETECNYNALMKAAGISELRYYNETGNELFVNEAGAFSNFIDKAKGLFKKMLEKVKSIFKAFLAKMNQFIMPDKKFAKEYRKELLNKSLSNLEFTGYYNFKNGWKVTNDNIKDFKFDKTDLRTLAASLTNTDELLKIIGTYHGNNKNYSTVNGSNNARNWKDVDKTTIIKSSGGYTADFTDNDVDASIETARGAILNGKGRLTEDDFREELTEILWGDKDTWDVNTDQVRNALDYLENSKDIIDSINYCQTKISNSIDKTIKELSDRQVAVGKISDVDYSNQDVKNNLSAITKCINAEITVTKEVGNAMTLLLGQAAKAAKDCSRQCKALCVKVISYNKKNESAYYGESYSESSDIFAGVDFA